MTNNNPPFNRAELLKLLAAGVLYFLTSWISRTYFTVNGSTSILFLASGVGLAALLLGGSRYFWSVFFGAFLANLWLGDAVLTGALIAGGAALAAWFGTWLISYRHKFNAELLSCPDLLKVGLGGFASALVSALIGTTTLWLAGVVRPEDYVSSLVDWWRGDTLGVVLVTTSLLVWWPSASRPYVRPSTKILLETALVSGLTVLVGGIAFLNWGSTLLPEWLYFLLSDVSQFFWMFLYLVWSAVRLGKRGTSLALLVIAVLDGIGIHHGIHHGRDFSHEVLSIYQLTSYWFYMVMLSLTGMALTIYVEKGKQVAQALLQRKAILSHELKSVVAALNQSAIVVTIDLQECITSVNDNFCDISGYAREELLGKNYRELSFGLHPEAFFEGASQAMTLGQVWRGEVCNLAKGGHSYWTHTVVSPFWGLNGWPEKYLLIQTDITQRQANELELQRYRDQLEQVVQQKTALLQASVARVKNAQRDLDQYMYVFDHHSSVSLTDLAGRLIYCNDKFCEITGYARDEILGQCHRVLDSGYHPSEFFKAMYDSVNQGGVWHAEICNRAKAGHLYWLDMTVTAFMGEDGKPVKYICVSNEITKRKRAEERAQAANQAKSEFLSNMSHEIRTPMNGVVGMADILQVSALTPEQHRMVQVIQTSSLDLLCILNDILDFSKIEAGKLEVEYIPTHLREVAERVTLLMQGMASAKQTEVALLIDPTLPTWLFSDPTRLRQILLNLLGNAIKFITRTDGKVLLSIYPTVRDDGVACVQFCVRDNGIGMQQDIVAKLFQPFIQADASSARKFGGTGLGLSITKRLVELMNGRVSVHSTLGLGSEFVVEFVLKEATQPMRDIPRQETSWAGVCVQSMTPTVQEAERSGQLILVAEDNEVNCDVLLEQLHLLGYAAERAEDGVVALALWRSQRFALLLTDCNMPNMDGFELTAAIRQCEPAGTHLPIVAVTGNAMQGEAERCLRQGMDDYLSKPLRLKELEAMLAKWLPPLTLPLPMLLPPQAMTAPALSSPAPAEPPVALSVWNPATLSQIVGDNPALHERLLEKFQVSAQKHVAVIGVAATTDDLNSLADVAHMLKSSARTVGALLLGALSEDLETAANAGDVPRCAKLAAQLPQALADAVQAITSSH